MLVIKSVEAERSVIGSILLDTEKLLEVAGSLSIEDFTDDTCGLIYDAILHLYRAGHPIDIVTVATRLQSQKLLDRIGGAETIAELQNEVPVATHIKQYAEIVKNRSIARKMQLVLSRGVDTSLSNEEQINSIITDLQSLARPVNNKSMTELLIEHEERKKNKGDIRPTGFKWLDDKLGGIDEGMFWCITAPSFLGKTIFALHSIRNLADKTGQKAVLYTLEQTAVNAMKALERIQNHEKQELSQLAMLPLEIVDTLYKWDEISIDAQKRNARVIIIDYAQMVNIKGDKAHEKLQNLAFAIRQFCNKTGIAVILISQVSEETRKNRGSYDSTKGGNDIYNACDVFINLRSDMTAEYEQREEDARTGGNPAFGGKRFERDIIIAKNKYGDIGFRKTLYNYEMGYGTYCEFNNQLTK